MDGERSDTASVGIVVPTNTSRYLYDALTSLLSQTAECDIVVVDDGSPNQEVSRTAGEFGMRFIRNATSVGPPTARNVGIEALPHPWIINFDGDNIAAPRFAEKLLRAALRCERTGIAYCLALQFDEATGPYKDVKRGLPFQLVYENFIDASSMFARSAWEEAGGWDPEASPLSDWDLWLGIVERGWRLGFVSEYLLGYRVRSAGLLRSTPRERFEGATHYIQSKHAAFRAERPGASPWNLIPRIANRVRRKLDERIVPDRFLPDAAVPSGPGQHGNRR
jgi:GT2 family glycosyltransferase